MTDILDALAALPDTAQNLPVKPVEIRDETLKTFEGDDSQFMIVKLPKRPADAAMFPANPDFEVWITTGLRAAFTSGNPRITQHLLEIMIESGLT
jgi:hypothetical protein